MQSEPNINFAPELEKQLAALRELGESFVRDIRAGLDPVFTGTVHPLSHAQGERPTFKGDNGTIVAWEFDGCVAESKLGPATFRGIGPLEPGTEVHFWGVHVFDESGKVLRIVDEGPLRAQLGIVDAGRPLVQGSSPKAAD